MEHRFITLTNPVRGDGAAYADWYANRHLGDTIQIPGVLGDQFLVAADPENARWRHLAIYEVDPAAIDSIFATMDSRAGTAEMPLHPLDRESFYFLIAEPANARAGEEGEAANCRLLALSTPERGREQELERWYDEQHIPDMLRIPGFEGAQRYRVKRSGRGNEPEWSFATIYAASAAEPLSLMQAIRARAGTAEMPITDALDRGSGITALYVAVTPHRNAD